MHMVGDNQGLLHKQKGTDTRLIPFRVAGNQNSKGRVEDHKPTADGFAMV